MGIHYDKSTIEQIRETNMIESLGNYNGFSFKKQGADYRCIEHNSLVVKSDTLRWYWNSKSVGGANVIDYLVKVENVAFPDAIDIVLKNFNNCLIINNIPKAKQKDILFLPEKEKFSPTKLVEYLCKKRKLDKEIIFSLLKENIIFQDIRGNVVFVGFDQDSNPRFASIRGTGDKQFRMDCTGSDKQYKA